MRLLPPGSWLLPDHPQDRGFRSDDESLPPASPGPPRQPHPDAVTLRLRVTKSPPDLAATHDSGPSRLEVSPSRNDPPGRPRPAFQVEQLGDPRPVVGKAVDPRHAQANHLALDPGPPPVVQMGQKTAMAVDAPAAEGKGHGSSQGQVLAGALGFGGCGVRDTGE